MPEPEGDARGRSVGLRIAAACQVKDGAVADAAVTAAAVLTVLPNGYSSGLIATTVDHVIPAAAHGRNADVAAFRSLLA